MGYFGGGGSTSSTTYVQTQAPTDPESVKVLAEVQRDLGDLQKEQWELYKTDFLPVDKELAEAEKLLKDTLTANPSDPMIGKKSKVWMKALTLATILDDFNNGL